MPSAVLSGVGGMRHGANCHPIPTPVSLATASESKNCEASFSLLHT